MLSKIAVIANNKRTGDAHMARAPYQVLIIPYIRKEAHKIMFALFRRSQEGYWQAIAGGGEEGESIIQTAKREAFEEAGIQQDQKYVQLDSCSGLSVVSVVGEFMWGCDTYIIPEHCFGVEVDNQDLLISSEHKEYKWVCYEEAIEMLKWDSNKTAIWELNQRLLRENLK